MNSNNFFPSDENTNKRSINLQVGVVGVILCLNDNIGEVGEAIGEDIGRKVMLGFKYEFAIIMADIEVCVVQFVFY